MPLKPELGGFGKSSGEGAGVGMIPDLVQLGSSTRSAAATLMGTTRRNTRPVRLVQHGEGRFACRRHMACVASDNPLRREKEKEKEKGWEVGGKGIPHMHRIYPDGPFVPSHILS
jgi:hypothetical protein